MKSAIVYILVCIFASAGHAQSTLRPKLVPERAEVAADIAPLAADTVTTPIDVVITGFDKPLRSSKETFFVVNRSDRELLGVALTISYSDMSGRNLLKRNEFIPCDIDPGDTGYLYLPSWDRQKTFYYHRNPPYRPRTSATPFDVAITVDYVVYKPLPPLTPLI